MVGGKMTESYRKKRRLLERRDCTLRTEGEREIERQRKTKRAKMLQTYDKI